MFLQMDLSNVKEINQIIVETDYGHVEVKSDGPNGFSSFKTYQGDNCIEYGHSKKLENPNYELIIVDKMS
tara:strand:+ start:148 stop:357 length:210 start_codon:yes stop_codon:yes gene_type:complete